MAESPELAKWLGWEWMYINYLGPWVSPPLHTSSPGSGFCCTNDIEWVVPSGEMRHIQSPKFYSEEGLPKPCRVLHAMVELKETTAVQLSKKALHPWSTCSLAWETQRETVQRVSSEQTVHALQNISMAFFVFERLRQIEQSRSVVSRPRVLRRAIYIYIYVYRRHHRTWVCPRSHGFLDLPINLRSRILLSKELESFGLR